MLRFESNNQLIRRDVAKNLCFILYVDGNFRSYTIILRYISSNELII